MANDAEFEKARAALRDALRLANDASLTVQQRRGLENDVRKALGQQAREQVISTANAEWLAATIKAEVAKSEELQDRIEAARILKNLDAESAQAAKAKAKRKRTAYELAGGRMDGKSMTGGDDETPKL